VAEPTRGSADVAETTIFHEPRIAEVEAGAAHEGLAAGFC
jgi:hypothetical protein